MLTDSSLSRFIILPVLESDVECQKSNCLKGISMVYSALIQKLSK